MVDLAILAFIIHGVYKPTGLTATCQDPFSETYFGDIPNAMPVPLFQQLAGQCRLPQRIDSWGL